VVKVKAALIQMEVESGNVAANRERALALASEAAIAADILILPEIWTTGYAVKDIEKWAEDENGPSITGLREIAKSEQVNIIAGSIPWRRPDGIYNGSVVINRQGEIIADYQKAHLFRRLHEEKFFLPGAKRCLFELDGMKAGLAICYDLRFPELFRALARDGAEIIFVPAEWPTVRGEAWRILNQARAIENQVFICAVNCVGEHRDEPFYGHSLLIDPRGRIIIEGGASQEILYGSMNRELLQKARASITVWTDRRPDLYV
jgi:predicted amidohydrolase